VTVSEFVELCEPTPLSPRQAEALYRRHDGETRQEAAEAMDCSPSNVDNLERAARQKLMQSRNLVGVARSYGILEDSDAAPAVGTCAKCDEPTSELRPDPRDIRPLEDRRMLCPDCQT
jgi:hypothetical protein